MILDELADLFCELEKSYKHRDIARQFGRERKFVIAMKCSCPFRLNTEFVAGLKEYGYELKLVKTKGDNNG